MILLVVLVVLAAAAGGLLALAGRESLRLQGLPVLPVRTPVEALMLMETGFRALDHASREATRIRMERRW